MAFELHRRMWDSMAENRKPKAVQMLLLVMTGNDVNFRGNYGEDTL